MTDTDDDGLASKLQFLENHIKELEDQIRILAEGVTEAAANFESNAEALATLTDAAAGASEKLLDAVESEIAQGRPQNAEYLYSVGSVLIDGIQKSRNASGEPGGNE